MNKNFNKLGSIPGGLNAPAAKAAPAADTKTADEDKSYLEKIKGKSKRTVLVSAGAVLLLISGLQYTGAKANEDKNAIPEDRLQGSGLTSVSNEPVRPGEVELAHWGETRPDVWYYRTPKISFYEKLLCLGLISRKGCSDEPRHPRYESMKFYGQPLPEVEPPRRYTTEIKIK